MVRTSIVPYKHRICKIVRVPVQISTTQCSTHTVPVLVLHDSGRASSWRSSAARDFGICLRNAQLRGLGGCSPWGLPGRLRPRSRPQPVVMGVVSAVPLGPARHGVLRDASQARKKRVACHLLRVHGPGPGHCGGGAPAVGGEAGQAAVVAGAVHPSILVRRAARYPGWSWRR